MRTSHPWRGVRLRTLEAGSDPDAPTHRVAVPADWDAAAAQAFAGLCCTDEPGGWDPLRLPDAADGWITRLVLAGQRSGLVGEAREFAETLHCLLLLRQGCPDRGVWRSETGPRGFVLNLASFADPDTGFDQPCFAAAARASALAARLAAAGGRGSLRIADLDGMLARLGLEYDSETGRDIAQDVVRQLKEAVGGTGVSLEAGRGGPADALLGVETSGFAPAFSLVGADGTLTMAARARLAGLGIAPERALALSIEGELPLRVAGAAAHAAMHDALAPLLDGCPPRPSVAPRLVAGGRARRRALPARSKGFTQKVTIGGHRLFLRTAEFADGSLGEIAITLPGREGAASRGLADAFAAAVSLGLQHGVPLETFVDAFAHSRFNASGPVDGDPAIGWASSPLDYVVRALAEAYLGRHLADPPADASEEAPTLPLGLDGEPASVPAPAGMRQRALRLVSPA